MEGAAKRSLTSAKYNRLTPKQQKEFRYQKFDVTSVFINEQKQYLYHPTNFTLNNQRKLKKVELQEYIQYKNKFNKWTEKERKIADKELAKFNQINVYYQTENKVQDKQLEKEPKFQQKNSQNLKNSNQYLFLDKFKVDKQYSQIKKYNIGQKYQSDLKQKRGNTAVAAKNNIIKSQEGQSKIVSFSKNTHKKQSNIANNQQNNNQILQSSMILLSAEINHSLQDSMIQNGIEITSPQKQKSQLQQILMKKITALRQEMKGQYQKLQKKVYDQQLNFKTRLDEDETKRKILQNKMLDQIRMSNSQSYIIQSDVKNIKKQMHSTQVQISRLKSQCKALNDQIVLESIKIKQLQRNLLTIELNKKCLLEQNIRSPKLRPASLPIQPQYEFKISSNILNQYPGKQFIKQQIQAFSNQSILRTELLFQKTQFNHNFSSYLQSQTYPILFLIQINSKTLFGAFTEGVISASTKSNANYQMPKFKAFMFNASRKRIFVNQNPTSLHAVMFINNFLKFGNGEVSIKNNSLDTINVSAGNILGQCYYNIPDKESLIESSESTVPIERLEIHRVYFKSL